MLDVARQVQRKRDNNRSQSLPCSGDEPSRRRHAPSINKSQRSLNEDDLLEAMIKLQEALRPSLVKGELGGNLVLTDQRRCVRYLSAIAIKAREDF